MPTKPYQLKITGDRDTLRRVALKIDRILDRGWCRDYRQELELESQAHNEVQMYCFVCSALEARPASQLWMSDYQIGVLEITHIRSQQGGQLSGDEYNYICEEFYQRFVVLATTRMNVQVDFTRAASSLEAGVSAEAASLLRKLASRENKSNRAVQPGNDIQWNTFFVTAHTENAALDGTALHQFLTAEAGWSADSAGELQVQYETARSLLKYYDSVMFKQSIAV